MKTLGILIKRNTKMFFKDKGIFFTSLITPAILLVLYVSFLANVYRDSIMQILNALAPETAVSGKTIDALVGGQLVSSLLAVCCVTVAFSSNMLSVQDKANSVVKDFSVAPVKRSTLACGYFISSYISSVMVAFTALGLGLIYLGAVGWTLRITDVLGLILDIILLVGFGTGLSSIINYFLSSQGQISAVGSIVSSGYGFICGAYMPISQFGSGLQTVLSFLPGTYGTSLFRSHALNGALARLAEEGVAETAVRELIKMFDCNVYFFSNVVPVWAAYVVVGVSVAILIGVYVLMFAVKKKGK